MSSTSIRQRRGSRLALVLLLVAGGVVSAQKPAPKLTADAGVDASLKERLDAILRESDVRGAQLKQLVTRITEMGPEVLPALFACWMHRSQLGSEPAPGTTYSTQVRLRRRRSLISGAFRALPKDAVSAWLRSQVGDESSLAVRLHALQLLTEIRGGAESVPVLVTAIQQFDALEVGVPGVSGTLQAAVRQVLAAGPAGESALVRSWKKIPSALQQFLIRMMGAGRDDVARRFLEQLLRRDEPNRSAILRRLAELPLFLADRCGEDTRKHVVKALRSSDWHLREAAATLAGKIHVEQACPALLRCLDHKNPRVSAAAARALSVISGRSLPPNRSAWEIWYDAEQEWTRDGLDEMLSDATSGNPAQAFAALRELSNHRVHRRRIAQELIPLLTDSDRPELRQTVCAVLSRLRATEALPKLLDALEDKDARVRRSAWRALTAITGLRLRQNQATWKKALQL